MDTMEPGNLKDGYWTIYFIIMTMAITTISVQYHQ